MTLLTFEGIRNKYLLPSYNNNNSMNKTIRHLGSYFPNIETLFIQTPLTTSEVAYIIGPLEFLSFLVIYYHE